MPIVAALVPAALAAYQGISGAIKAKKARQSAQNQQNPSYAPSKAVNDYYQTALNRYNAGPYNSLQYQQAKKAADTGLSTGISALQDRRSGVGNIGALTTGYSNNLQRAGAAAEQTQRQNFAQLGQATGQKLGDDRFGYEQNKVAPFQRNLQWDYAQLGGANSLISAGISNLGTAAQTYGLQAMRKDPKYNQGGYGGYGY